MFCKPMYLLPVAALILVVAQVGLKSANEEPWVQVVGEGLLRSNSPPIVVAAARNAVLNTYQNLVENADGVLWDPTCERAGQCWKSGQTSEPGVTEVSRGRTQIKDRNGKTLAIEQIMATDAPTLVFIAYDGPGGAAEVAKSFVGQLERRGVSVRR
jgi:hypothetical protein